MSNIDIIFARRSIRQYTDEPVTAKQVRTLLEAGMAAPSASNRQPWHFVAVTQRETLQALADAHPFGKMLAGAALAIAVCADPAISSKYWIQDCSAASENILVAGAALGLGGVWLGCYPNDERVAPIRRVLGIPDDIQVLSLLSIGHPAETKPSRTQYDEVRVHPGHW
ncbi:MAG: nitroreductase family protein [Chloroflexi bacterium]|nr:nitroreductase family protein [Chloroflexota bacterium]MBU1750305.1 nitroreductase family protein [Chloroflexota bacterium]